MKHLGLIFLLAIGLNATAQRQWVATFDNLPLSKSDTFWNGSDSSGGFSSAGFIFPNNYNHKWNSWSGWAFSNMHDTLTEGYKNQYSCMEKGAINGTSNFIVCSGSPWVIFSEKLEVSGAYVTNAAFATLSLRNGDGFAKKFGGASGDDPDWFKITAFGYANGSAEDSVEFYLADYRFGNNDSDYIVDQWTWFDMSDLGAVDSIQFVLSSTDVGQFGMNTPSYFCMDDFNGLDTSRNDLEVVKFDQPALENDSFYNGSDMAGGFVAGYAFFPNSYNSKWGAWSGWSISNKYDTTDATFANQYSAKAQENGTFAVAYNNTSMRFGYGDKVFSSLPTISSRNLMISNTNYTYKAILDGTAFSKKFGGTDGNDPDYYGVTITGVDFNGDTTGTIDVYLADYRSADNSKDYIVKDWMAVNISGLMDGRSTVRLDFNFFSSDTGQYGINTPTYFAMKDFNLVLSAPNVDIVHALHTYPNPANDVLNIPVDGIEDITIMDLQGKTHTVQLEGAKINVQHLPAGMYVISGIQDNKIYRGKFIKH